MDNNGHVVRRYGSELQAQNGEGKRWGWQAGPLSKTGDLSFSIQSMFRMRSNATSPNIELASRFDTLLTWTDLSVRHLIQMKSSLLVLLSSETLFRPWMIIIFELLYIGYRGYPTTGSLKVEFRPSLGEVL